MRITHAPEVGAVERVPAVTQADDVIDGRGALLAARHSANRFLSEHTGPHLYPVLGLVDSGGGGLRTPPVGVGVVSASGGAGERVAPV